MKSNNDIPMKKNKTFGNYWSIQTKKDKFKKVNNKRKLMNKTHEYLVNGNENFKIIYDISLNYLGKIKGSIHKVHQTNNSSSLINKDTSFV